MFPITFAVLNTIDKEPNAKIFDLVDHNKLWKILQEMGIPDHLTCLLRNLYAGQEATVRMGHGGEGNGTPLQYSCWENPMDGGAW